MRILVINSGSSSIKFSVYDMEQEMQLIGGKIERIGQSHSISTFHRYSGSEVTDEHQEHAPVVDHVTGLARIFRFIESDTVDSIQAVGHRVVHGGETYQQATRIDPEVIKGIRAMTNLAPLHNPANLAGIEATTKLYPQLPQVAVFDTAFFSTLPPRAFRYALPDHLYHEHHLRRYGFHGTSHQHVASQAAVFLQQPLENLRLITLHLGHGASVAAIRNGICIDTSMGMTPLEGLIMGTRCGDLDPSIPFFLARNTDMSLDEIEALLQHDSGLKGLCGAEDMREVHRLADTGETNARLALEMYCYRIAKYVGAYYVALGGLDALIFTAGVGENATFIRQSVCVTLHIFGITVDAQRNDSPTPHARSRGVCEISAADSKVKVLVIPTNEQLEIARQTAVLLQSTGNVDTHS